MHLKSLNIKGFKSFASSTVFRLEPGITCVVGPNGSGKSNVVDALAWVMGEQGAKTLRGASMADVIFAGTSGKPALGRAQVELTIDNADGALPIEYSEVTISRTLFRSGGSEYSINGAPARLLDVQELLSDTGMGKQMHVIVGQGQLDAVLRATPEDRRGFIDEAAGVLKHRRRKERALRKLEAMDANLVRVLDLTDEIKRQLRPLARQAKAAKEAQGIQDTIEWAKRRLLADDIDQLWIRLKREHAEIQQFKADTQTQEEQFELLKRESSSLEQRAVALRQEIDQYQELLRQFDAVKERLGSKLTVVAERRRQIAGSVAQISTAAIELADEKAAETEQAAAQALERLRQAQDSAEKCAETRSDVEEQLRSKRVSLQEKEAQLAKEQEEIARVREQATRAQSQFEAAQNNAEAAKEKLQQSRERLAFTRETAADLDLDGDLKQGGASADLAQLHVDAVAAETKARRDLEQAQEGRRQAQSLLAKWKATRDALEQSIEAQHLVDVPAQKSSPKSAPESLPASLQRRNWKPTLFLDEVLKVQEGWEEAITALLRPYERAVVLGSDDTVEDALGWAEKNGQALRAVRATGAIDPQSETSAPHFAGALPSAEPSSASSAPVSMPALDAVAYPAQLADAMQVLLKDKWLSPSLGQAQAALEETPQQTPKIIATCQGQVVGKYTASTQGDEGASVLALRAQWAQAAENTRDAEEALARAERAVDDGKEKLTQASQLQSQALQNLREYDVQQSKIAQERARVAARVAGAEEEVERFLGDHKAASEACAQAELALQQSKEALRAQPPVDVAQFLAPWRLEVEKAEQSATAAREAQMNAKLELRSAEEQSRAATRSADAFRAQAAQMRQNRQLQLEQEKQREAAREVLQEIALRAEDAYQQSSELSQKVAQDLRIMQERKEQLEEQVKAGRAELEQMQWRRNNDGQARQQAEVAFAQTKLQFQQAIERCEELLEVELPEKAALQEEPVQVPQHLSVEIGRLLGRYGPDQPMLDSAGNPVPYSRAQVHAQMVSAQREIARLGQVNPLAVEEYESLSQRHQFLVDQVSDLKKSKSDLLQIVKDVDQRIEQAFVEAFADTQEAFEQVFGVLFPGGKGRLSLTDPDDPLHTGVEIYARPAGKKVTRLSLLSGGERSLAALAYLIAIFQARPSPFYVMDEVEAALDDLNISRVLTIFEQLRQSSQLILITHQKRTMEIADALYGVTMREGVTTVVSHKMK